MQIHVARNCLLETSFFCLGDALVLRIVKTHGCAVLCGLNWHMLVTSQSVSRNVTTVQSYTITDLDRESSPGV